MQGNMVSSEYAVSEYINNVPRQKLKNTFQEYLPNAPTEFLSQCTTIIKIM